MPLAYYRTPLPNHCAAPTIYHPVAHHLQFTNCKLLKLFMKEHVDNFLKRLNLVNFFLKQNLTDYLNWRPFKFCHTV